MNELQRFIDWVISQGGADAWAMKAMPPKTMPDNPSQIWYNNYKKWNEAGKPSAAQPTAQSTKGVIQYDQPIGPALTGAPDDKDTLFKELNNYRQKVGLPARGSYSFDTAESLLQELNALMVTNPIGGDTVPAGTQAQIDWYREQQASSQAFTAAQNQAELERQRLGTEMSQYEAARQQMVNSRAGMTEGDKENLKAQWWDDIRTQIMDSIKDVPSEWINYQQLQLQENPHKQVETEADAMLKSRERYGIAKDSYKEAKDLEKMAKADPNISLTGADKAYIEYATQEWKSAKDSLYSTWEAAGSPHTEGNVTPLAPFTPPKLEGYQETDKGLKPYYSYGEEEAPAETKGVKTPDWMGQYASQLKNKPWIPGTGNVGGKLTEVNPLSGQAANRLSPTRLEMLKGLVSFSGQQPADWIQSSVNQLPQTLSLGKKWQPAR